MGTFYICATPIGNLDDISIRLKDTLAKVDVIYAEDTRRANKLLNHLDIKKPVSSYFVGNEKKKIDEIIDLIEESKSVALISDAGTPLISDPGEELVKALILNEIKIESIPGPSSVMVALTLSGFDTNKFQFHGFIPKSGKEREDFFSLIKTLTTTLVCFTSPNRLLKDLEEFVKYKIDNELVICRELTKKFESIYRGTAQSLIDDLSQNKIKGEVTIVVSKSDIAESLDTDIQKAVDNLLRFNIPKRDIAKILSSLTSFGTKTHSPSFFSYRLPFFP